MKPMCGKKNVSVETSLQQKQLQYMTFGQNNGQLFKHPVICHCGIPPVFGGKPQAIFLRRGNLQFDGSSMLGPFKITTFEAMSELLSEYKQY